jgi:fructose-1,6-bisphosphatase/sedoheptulose 1,7-bisphosphatase-like protein
MDLRSTEAKRLTRRLLSKEPLALEVVGLDRARQLVHILESLGAKIEIRGDGDLTCV